MISMIPPVVIDATSMIIITGCADVIAMTNGTPAFANGAA
jgi:hypothetical protein